MCSIVRCHLGDGAPNPAPGWPWGEGERETSYIHISRNLAYLYLLGLCVFLDG